ncbi:MAG: MGMT family protein [bacterium]|nr:MGMT family protein [bacterium]MDD5756869.1 MGMT family protein [bacterium]
MKKEKSKKRKITEFEKKVYAACKTIPRGETRSYAWIAKKIGQPRACRAVGNALHKNPFAPAVPCHRVIRSDGNLGGFASGTAKKIRLLGAEKRAK